MSSKKSLYYENGVHIYEEQFSGQLCVEIESMFIADDGTAQKAELNEKYASNTIDAAELKRSLDEYLKDNK